MFVKLIDDAGILSNQKLRSRGRDVVAGAICSILSISCGLSYAALFSGRR
jgi:hypothetical protein